MASKKQKCRFCGCTDNRACSGSCHWICPNVCSKCEGRLIAEARDKFFEEHVSLIVDAASGVYLKNRLEMAFISGWNAAIESLRGHK